MLRSDGAPWCVLALFKRQLLVWRLSLILLLLLSLMGDSWCAPLDRKADGKSSAETESAQQQSRNQEDTEVAVNQTNHETGSGSSKITVPQPSRKRCKKANRKQLLQRYLLQMNSTARDIQAPWSAVNVSICNSVPRWDTDVDRYPSVVPSVECRPNPRLRLMQSYRGYYCLPIAINRQVLFKRRGECKRNGKEKWEFKFKKIGYSHCEWVQTMHGK